MDSVEAAKSVYKLLSKTTEPEKLFVFLANDMSYHTHYIDAFNNYYETNKIEFYERATKSPFYTADLFSDKRLEQEIYMRRIYAILLAAEENEDCKKFVWNTIEEFPLTKKLLKVLKKGNSFKYSDYLDSLDKSDNALLCISGMTTLYYIYCNYGFDTEVKHYQAMLAIELNNCSNRLAGFNSSTKKRIDSINYFDYVIFNPIHRKTFRSIENLGEFLSIFDTKIRKNGIDLAMLSNKLKPYYKSETKFENLYDIKRFLTILSKTFNYFGLSPTSYFQAIKLNDEDKATILKIAAQEYAIDPNVKFPELPFYYYILTTFLYFTSKSIKMDRDCFFENNSETQFFALKESADEISKLTTEILKIKEKLGQETEEKEKYRKLYSSLQDEILTNQQKNEKEVYSTFKTELDSLKDKIAMLESELAEKEKDAQELYRLRELAFSLESSDALAREVKPIDEVIKKHKVIIVGGHINFRNKLSEKHKALTFIDGHNVNFDENALKSADLVLFNTANMSHSLYYKIMPVLKSNNIKFDYIGRSLNLEILEDEISHLLEKHFK